MYEVRMWIGNYTVPLGCGHLHRTYSGAERCARHHHARAYRDARIGGGWYRQPPDIEIVDLDVDPELADLEREADRRELEAYYRELEKRQREAEAVEHAPH